MQREAHCGRFSGIATKKNCFKKKKRAKGIEPSTFSLGSNLGIQLLDPISRGFIAY